MENIGYDVSVIGIIWVGDFSRFFIVFVVIGIYLKVFICLFRILRRGKGKKVIGILKGNLILNILFIFYINF